ncbi:LysR family transcriptional regulator [Parasalinivibrio latis]
MRGMPSIKALKTFVEVAQSRSFSKAAQTLCLSQSAISKQIQQLENQLGTSLFERHGSGVELTEAGMRYLGPVFEALDILSQATSELIQRQEGHTTVKIHLPPSLANLWLIPRLGQDQALEGVRLAVVAGTEHELNDSNEVDIRCLRNIELPDHCECLKKEKLLLLVRPDRLPAEVEKVSDMLSVHAIPHITRPHLWSNFWHSHGVPQTSPVYGTGFEHFYMSLEAVKNGAGMALIPDFLARDALAREEVVNPLEIQFSSGYGYYLIRGRHQRFSRAAVRVKEWLAAQLALDN